MNTSKLSVALGYLHRVGGSWMFRTKKSTSIGSQKVLHLGLKEDPQGPDKGHRKRFRNFGTIKPVDKLVAYIPVGLKKGEQRALLTVRHFEVQTSMTL